jgi:hypothetical protein
MDASSVPQEYLFTIYTQCFTFPERIIFFLTGKLQARYLGWRFQLPDIDNYFIISCTNAPDRRPDPPHIPGRPTKPPHMPPAPPRPPKPPRYDEGEAEEQEAEEQHAAAWREREREGGGEVARGRGGEDGEGRGGEGRERRGRSGGEAAGLEEAEQVEDQEEEERRGEDTALLQAGPRAGAR